MTNQEVARQRRRRHGARHRRRASHPHGLSEVLAKIDYGLIQAADGPSGLRIVQAGDRIDLQITDVGLPSGLNGRQVADAERVINPKLKVLFISGFAENAAVGNGHLD